jgi:hypothetical protein
MCIGVVGIIVTTVTAGGDMDIAIAAGGNFKSAACNDLAALSSICRSRAYSTPYSLTIMHL